MAIGLNLTNTQYGVSFPNAYGRIVTASVMRQNSGAEHNKHTVMIDVVVYATQEAASNDNTQGVAFERLYVPYTEVAGTDFMTECYTWLLTQEQFAGGVAV
jgi:hypothetical protein